MLQEFNVEGMSCGHCVIAVEKKLNTLDLQSMKVKIGEVKVECDPEKTNEDRIINVIEEAGYKVVSSEQ